MFARKKRALAAVLTILMLAAVVLTAGASGARVSLTAGGGTEYETYTNDHVKFTIDYPRGSEMSEPYDNVVMFTVADGFQAAVEYTCQTAAADRFLYSAADFADMIAVDSQVLADWVGVDNLTVTAAGRTDAGYRFDYAVSLDSGDWTGSLLLFDGEGEFGCYCVQGMILNDAQADDHWEQFEHMAASFQVTDAYQQEGMTVYEVGDWDMEFMILDENYGDARFDQDPIATTLTVTPAQAGSSFVMDKMTYDSSYSLEAIMDESVSFILTKPDAQLLSGPSTETIGIGRYPTGMYMASYTGNFGTVISMNVYISHEGDFWCISSSCSEDDLDATMKTVSDLLFSLRFGGDPDLSGLADLSGSVGGAAQLGQDTIRENVNNVLDRIEGQDIFYRSEYTDPLISVTDVDRDGRQELLALYEGMDDTGMISAIYELWILQEDGAGQLAQDVLFPEVGGNDGSIGLCQRDGRYYFTVSASLPDGDQLNNYDELFPFRDDGIGFEPWQVHFESHASYDAPGQGQYIMGGTEVSAEEYSAESEAYDYLTLLNFWSTPDPSSGVMTFDQARAGAFS